jgi:hypothetical protein
LAMHGISAVPVLNDSGAFIYKWRD